MPMQRRRTKKRLIVLAIVIMTAIAGIAVGAGAIDRARAGDERPRWSDSRLLPTLSQRMAMLDAAIARGDVSRATREWQDAVSLALAARRWQAMVDMGDAAVKIDALAGRPAGYPTGFRAQARQAYLTALFRARSQRAPEGIERVAKAFAALGDTDMATRAQALGATTR